MRLIVKRVAIVVGAIAVFGACLLGLKAIVSQDDGWGEAIQLLLRDSTPG